jgi:hypothetical protein
LRQKLVTQAQAQVPQPQPIEQEIKE